MKIGFLINDGAQPYLVWDLIEKSRLSDEYSIDLLVVQRTPGKTERGLLTRAYRLLQRHGFWSFFEKSLLTLISAAEKIVVARDPLCEQVFVERSLDDIDIPKIFVTPTISKSGYVYRYNDDDIALIRNANLDVLLRGGSGILKGAILDVCKFGILSIHHGNNDVNRGGPPAFWEVLNRQPYTGFVIQRLTEELDGGDVICKGQMPTSYLYMENQCKLYRKSSFFMDHVLRKIAVQEKITNIVPKTPYAYGLFRAPKMVDQLRYLAKTSFYLAKKVVDKISRKDWRWGVAYQYVENWKSAVLWKSKIIRNPPNRFLADPFVFRKHGSDVIFVEDYDYTIKKGSISAYRVDARGYEDLGKVVEEPFHLAYPFLFEVEQKLFMCPETSAAGDIRLYECIEFPLRWKLHKVLIENIVASDSGIFFHDGLWWMLTNVDTSDLVDQCSELHVFFAEEFDSDDWHPHPSNPVIFDAKCARNGGLLFDQNKGIYRVFQRQGFDLYGEAMGVARIDTISTTDYRETVLFDVEPGFFNGISGTHTYSFHDGLMALDFVKREGIRS